MSEVGLIGTDHLGEGLASRSRAAQLFGVSITLLLHALVVQAQQPLSSLALPKGQAISPSLIANANSTRVALPLLAARVDPTEFGVQDETRTVISATAFLPQWVGGVDIGSRVDPTLGRLCQDCLDIGLEYYANLDLPAGAVIDFIGINNSSDTDAVLGFALWERDRFANMALLSGFSFPAHGWDTDFAGPLGIQVTDHVDKEYVLNVEQAPNTHIQFFAWVEVWWHRTVSPPPATPSFNDVPPSHQFFQFIEALRASGITAGCGDGTNYCPDSPLTRGQMAVFLSKALGLHWPN